METGPGDNARQPRTWLFYAEERLLGQMGVSLGLLFLSSLSARTLLSGPAGLNGTLQQKKNNNNNKVESDKTKETKQNGANKFLDLVGSGGHHLTPRPKLWGELAR